MYRMLPKKFIVFAIAWLVIGLCMVVISYGELLGVPIGLTSIPLMVWVMLHLLLLNPVWRWVWAKIPWLSVHFFPDLNGKWKVELHSNWPRQLQLLEAAQSKEKEFDMRNCGETELAELSTLELEADIRQSWWKIEMSLYNPVSVTPIRQSNTISIIPFAQNGLQKSGILYIFKQENMTDNVSDSNEFYGAARLEYDFGKDELSGLVWTARMWQRAMNTASKVTFKRLPCE